MLTGKETKQELQERLDTWSIEYSKLDTKDVLIQKLNEYFKNSTEQETFEKVEVDELNHDDGDLITGDQYCSIEGHNTRTRHFIQKKYGNDTFGKIDWYNLFSKEGLL